MIKRISRKILGLLLLVSIFFGLFTVLFSTPSNVVSVINTSAETEPFVRNSAYDANFSFEPGAAVGYSSIGIFDEEDNFIRREVEIDKLGFMLNLKNPNFDRTPSSNKDNFLATFVLYQDLGNNNCFPVYEIALLFVDGNFIQMHKQLIYDPAVEFDLIDISPSPVEGVSSDLFIDYRSGEYGIAPKSDDYTVDYIAFGKDGDFFNFAGEDNPYFRFYVKLNSFFSNYFVRFSYEFRHFLRMEWDGPFQQVPVYSTVVGTIDSDTRSVFTVINNIWDAGAFEEEFGIPDSVLYNAAYDIYQSGYVQDVTIEYLQRIANSPFAKKVQSSISVPVHQNSISYSDVIEQIGVEAITPLNSAIRNFEYDAYRDVYVAKYNKNIWLEARAVDGNVLNVFLDCNLSYEDYFLGLKTDDFTNDLYEYCWSRLVEEYPEVISEPGVNGPEDIYGYFGFVPIPNLPELGSVDALFADLFDVGTKTYGQLSIWNYTEILTIEEYNDILANYKYSFLDRFWNTAWNVVSNNQCQAVYYLFYVDDITDTRVVISENGAATPGEADGVLENTAELVVEETGKYLGDVINNATSSIDGLFTSIESTFKSILAVAFGGFIIFAIFFVCKKIQKKDGK